MIFSEIEDRKERKRARLKHFGSPLLSKKTIEKMVEEPDVSVERYINMYIEPIRKPRIRDGHEPVHIPKHEVKKALKEIREELGYPDFRHKIWRNS